MFLDSLFLTTSYVYIVYANSTVYFICYNYHHTLHEPRLCLKKPKGWETKKDVSILKTILRMVQKPPFFFKNRLIFLSALAALISVKKPQNVYRMICANILCGKLSKKLFLLHLNRLTMSKSNDFMPKLVHLLLNVQNGSISIRMHQNVSRMNCANVLYTKLSKK